MTAFAIDTGSERPATITALVEGDGRPDFRNFNAAERLSRKITANIWACDTLPDLIAYEAGEALLLDGLFLAWPELSAAVTDAIDTQRACLAPRPPLPAKGDPQPAVPVHQPDNSKGKKMFDIDTGSDGSQGPWLAWTVQGTGNVPAKSFYIRDTNGKTLFEGFASGIVLDVVNMKTGWQHSEGLAGVAPKWVWNRTVSRFEPSPGDDYKKGFQIACAIGGGLTATWEQAGSGAWNAFTALIPALQGGPGGDMLPLVKMTGSFEQKFAKGKTASPILEIAKWVPRPACLKEGAAAGIATEPEPVKPAAKPAPVAELADSEF